jgi:DNA-binding transcriptional regulator YdaS (Cro superfamily)
MKCCSLCSRQAWRGVYCERHHPATDPTHIKTLEKAGLIMQHNYRADMLFDDYLSAKYRAKNQMFTDNINNQKHLLK